MRFSALPLVILAPLFAAAAGCHHRAVESICRQSCECEPCTDADLEACIERATAAADKARKQDCAKEIDAYLVCVDDKLSCQHGAGPGTTECGKEETALVKCTGTGNPFANVCEQASAKFATCTGQPVPPSNGSDCPPDQECQSLCVVQATCEEVLGQVSSPSFQNCINECFTK